MHETSSGPSYADDCAWRVGCASRSSLYIHESLSLENDITVAQSEVEGVRYIPIHRPFLQRVPGRFFEEISDPTDRASKYNMPI